MSLTKQQKIGIGLGIASAIGTVASIIFSAKNTKKYEKEQAELPHDATTKEKTWTWIRCYYPTLLTGAATIAAEVANNYISVTAQTKLAGAAAAATGFMTRYIDETKWQYGEDADARIKKGMAEHIAQSDPNNAVYAPSAFDITSILPDDISGEDPIRLYYDPVTETWFHAPHTVVMQAFYHINRNFMMSGTAYVDELYEFLGLIEIEKSNNWKWHKFGWACDDMDTWFIDFDVYRADGTNSGEPYYILSYITPDVIADSN